MRTFDILRLSMKNALRGRTRTFLTILAIAIGVLATLLVVSIGGTARSAVSTQLDNIGISGVAVYAKKVAVDKNISLTGDDARAVMSSVDGVAAALPVVVRYGSYAIKNWTGNAIVYGVGDRLGDTLQLDILYGKLPSASDIRRSSDVAVVDAGFATTVYGRENIVGKTINLTLDGTSREFEIIGVIASQSAGISALIGQSLPVFIYVPISSIQKLLGINKVEQMLVTMNADGLADDVIDFLDHRHREIGAFRYEDISGMRRQVDEAMLTLSVFIAAIGAISMVVAGIGIMNTMLSTAIERRREVGIYMSLGARRSDIMLGFLAEAGVISAVGGLCGILCCAIVVSITRYYSGFTMELSIAMVAATELAAVLCGIVFGVLPAIRASKLDPIEALKD